MGTGMVKLDNQIKPNKMTATLTFELPDDQYAYNYTLNAARYKDALTDIMNVMRNEVKYGNHDEITHEVLDNLYVQFGEITGGLLDV
jgi:hypothetical protein